MAGRRNRITRHPFGYMINTSRERLPWKITVLLVLVSVLMSINIMYLVHSQPTSDEVASLSDSLPFGLRKKEQKVFDVNRRSIQAFANKPVDNPPVYQEESLNILPNDNFVIIKADGDAVLNPEPQGNLPRAANAAALHPTPMQPPKVIGSLKRNTLPPIDPKTSITPNEILLRTAVAIKTFNRPQCCYRTVRSFRKNYPNMAIFVADDSFEDVLSANLTREFDVIYIRLHVDSGVGYGRNQLVQAIKSAGYQFLIMSDDDYTVEETDLLLSMAQRYIVTKADAVGPIRCDFGHCERSLGMIHISKTNKVSIFPNVTMYPDELLPKCKRSDLLQQFFLAQTDLLSKHGWDNALKNNDHYDFLFTAKRANLKLVSCFDIKVMHNKKTCQEQSKLIGNYLKVRGERWLRLMGHMFKKWKLQTMFDETGKQFKIVGNNPVITTPQKLVVNKANPQYKYFVNAILSEHNRLNPAWFSYKSIPNSRKTYIVQKQMNPCLYWVAGKIAARYDRHASFPNKDTVHSFQFHHFNKSCDIAEDFWKLKSFGKTQKQHVFFITAVSSDEVHMKRLLHLINNQTVKSMTSLVIVDMGNSKEKFDVSKYKISVPMYYVYLGAPFSRSIGLRRGFDFAKQLAAKKGYTNAIGFSMDTSIVMPADFNEVVRRNVRCGISTFAPVCYKSKDPGGYWVTTGYGMVGACFDDYDSVGGWDTRWGYRWGAEDVDIMNRLQDKVPYTIRTLENGFFHKHTGSSRKSHKEYYSNKNMYDKELPTTPITEKIVNPQFLKRLEAYALPKMKYPVKLKLTQAFYTPAGKDRDQAIIDIRFKNAAGESYYAILSSFF